MKIKRNVLSLFLCICMVLSVVPVIPIVNAEKSGNGEFCNSDVEAKGDTWYYASNVSEERYVYRQEFVKAPTAAEECGALWGDSEQITDFPVDQIAYYDGVLYVSVDNTLRTLDDTGADTLFFKAEAPITRFAFTNNCLYYLVDETLYAYDLAKKAGKPMLENETVLHFWLEDADTLSYMTDEDWIHQLNLTSGKTGTVANNASDLGNPLVKTNDARGATLTTLRAKFPHGKYWNHMGMSQNNADGYTNIPCNHDDNGTSYCNSFLNLSWQCMGYAEKCGYDVSEYNPRNNQNGWYTYYSSSAVNNIKAGDIVRYQPGDNQHSIYVTSVSGDTVYYTDCNIDGPCQIRWDASISKSTLKASFIHLRSAPGSLTPSGPVSFDSIAVSSVSTLNAKISAWVNSQGTSSERGFYLGTSADTMTRIAVQTTSVGKRKTGVKRSLRLAGSAYQIRFSGIPAGRSAG